MRTAGALAGAIMIVILNPIAAYASCHTVCANHCSARWGGDNADFFICYEGCSVGCERGPTEPTTN